MILYVSDLDGTLLNSNQELSSATTTIINDLLKNGMNFSIATARSLDSAGRIIEPLHLKLPIILHNGVFVYDPIKKENILSNYMDIDTVYDVLEICKKTGVSPLLYTKNENLESRIYYKRIAHYGEADYIQDRLKKGDKRFRLIDDFSLCMKEKIITIVMIEERQSIESVYAAIRNFNIHCHYTVDIYSKANWLEVTHKQANKCEAVKYIKKLVSADRIVCFGDNLNDSPMFEVADEKYAVRNAHDLLKNIATCVIDSNNADGVAKYLKTVYNRVSNA
ncbi:MAG: hypothetical protein K0Q53_2198 [Massilibacillus sp.]|nr:hypothetical protein [Massilibacillus sp.]